MKTGILVVLALLSYQSVFAANADKYEPLDVNLVLSHFWSRVDDGAVSVSGYNFSKGDLEVVSVVIEQPINNEKTQWPPTVMVKAKILKPVPIKRLPDTVANMVTVALSKAGKVLFSQPSLVWSGTK